MENEKDNKQDKKKNRRLILAIIFALFGITDIVLAIIFIPKFLKKNKEDNKYIVTQESINRYSNILTYINKETKGVYPSSSSLVSYTLEDKVLKLSTIIENDKSLYIELSTTYESYDEALKGFDNEVSIGTYPITVKYEDITSYTLDVQVDKYLCIHTKSVSESYISTTYLKDKNMYSYSHQQDLDIGSHKKVSYEEDKELYDFYYYLIYKD